MSASAQDEVVRICQELIRIDTTNYGDGSGPGERAAADYVVGLLQEVGLDPEIIESDPGRASVVVRIPGTDRERGALCIHGHLDVVPADAADWQVDPFAGELRDGCIWGRGAVDMKDMDAMMLASVRELVRSGEQPPRDLVLVFFADEEAGGTKGSHYVVDRTSSPGSPRRSARWAGIRSPSAITTECRAAPTSCRPPRRASPGSN